ncbi:hypothetical protein GWK47_039633 [Chionoecetes opilio]|uniref:Elongator complex protein 5 n=1 Tax=Chionoecetes opilio TaxID=41210 RepID=A0A8J4YK98_CHIOP|nr:hypothetical protein GWK47_039633 [Chionoecetes opilio]
MAANDTTTRPDNIVNLHRYYQTHAADTSFKKRTLWFEFSEISKQYPDVAVVEYVGQQPSTREYHGNCKNVLGKTPYTRTNPEVIKKIKENIHTACPKKVFNQLRDEAEGDINLEPRNIKQVADIKTNMQNTNKKTYRSNIADEILEVFSMLNSHPYVQEVASPKGKAPCVILYTNEQLEDTRSFLSAKSDHVLGIDRTFNTGACFVTTLVYKNLRVLRSTTREHPIVLGPIFLHWDATYDTYHTFLAHIKRELESDLAAAEFNIGSDEEAALVKAATDLFPKATRYLCTKHLRDNASRYLSHQVGASSKDRNKITDDIFGTDGLINLDSTFHFEQKANDLQNLTATDYPKFNKYFEGRVKNLLLDNVNGPHRTDNHTRLWTNNNCESMNNQLKLSVDWKPKKLPDLIEAIHLQGAPEASHHDGLDLIYLPERCPVSLFPHLSSTAPLIEPGSAVASRAMVSRTVLDRVVGLREAPPPHLLLLTDTVDVRGRGLLYCMVRAHLRAGTHVLYLTTNLHPEELQQHVKDDDTVGKVEFIDGVTDPCGWDSGEPAACVTRPLPEVMRSRMKREGKVAVVVDRLEDLSLHQDSGRLSGGEQGCVVTRVVSESMLQAVTHLASGVLHLQATQPVSCAIVIKKPSGKVIKAQEEFILTPDLRVEGVRPALRSTGQGGAAGDFASTSSTSDSTTDSLLAATTFSLALTEEQRRAKNELLLPHTRVRAGRSCTHWTERTTGMKTTQTMTLISNNNNKTQTSTSYILQVLPTTKRSTMLRFDTSRIQGLVSCPSLYMLWTFSFLCEENRLMVFQMLDGMHARIQHCNMRSNETTSPDLWDSLCMGSDFLCHNAECKTCAKPSLAVITVLVLHNTAT